MNARERITAWAALADAATEGRWVQDTDDAGIVWGEQRSDGDGYWSLFASETGHNASAEVGDAAFVAASRTAVPAMAAALTDAMDAMSEHWQYQVRRESKFGRKGSSCVCDVCDAMRAIEAALGVES